MREGKKEIPEFLMFDRLDELENITLELMEKADVEKPSVEDALRLAKHASIIAEYGLVVAFGGILDQAKNKSEARDAKNIVFDGIREGPVIAERVDVLEEIVSGMVDDVRG